MTTNNLTNLLSFCPKLLNSTRATSLGTSLSTWKDPALPLNREVTEVSIPGMDATVIVDVLNSQLTNKYSNTRFKITQVKIMESLPGFDVLNSSPSELLASPLNITIQQNVNEENNSSSQFQEPMETIPIEQIDHINAKSQKRKHPDITTDKPFMFYGIWRLSSFHKTIKTR